MNDIADVKHRKFVELLYKNTVDRRIKWSINDVLQVYVKFTDGTLFILDGINDQGEDTIVFRLFDDEAKLTDSFTDDNLRFDSYVPEGFHNWYLKCRALYEMAKRNATGADNLLDSMIAELDDDPIF